MAFNCFPLLEKREVSVCGARARKAGFFDRGFCPSVVVVVVMSAVRGRKKCALLHYWRWLLTAALFVS